MRVGVEPRVRGGEGRTVGGAHHDVRAARRRPSRPAASCWRCWDRWQAPCRRSTARCRTRSPWHRRRERAPPSVDLNTPSARCRGLSGDQHGRRRGRDTGVERREREPDVGEARRRHVGVGGTPDAVVGRGLEPDVLDPDQERGRASRRNATSVSAGKKLPLVWGRPPGDLRERGGRARSVRGAVQAGVGGRGDAAHPVAGHADAARGGREVHAVRVRRVHGDALDRQEVERVPVAGRRARPGDPALERAVDHRGGSVRAVDAVQRRPPRRSRRRGSLRPSRHTGSSGRSAPRRASRWRATRRRP